jgi:hypothetical protein
MPATSSSSAAFRPANLMSSACAAAAGSNAGSVNGANSTIHAPSAKASRIDECGVDPALDLGVDEIRDEVPAPWRLAFEARRHIHTVAKDVGVGDDDFAKIDADPELDAPARQRRRIAVRHGAPDCDGTGDGVNRTAKFDQRAVTHGLGDASAVSSHRGPEYFCPDQFEMPKRARLVRAHEPCVADDIGSEYSGKSAHQVRVVSQRWLAMAGAPGSENFESNGLAACRSYQAGGVVMHRAGIGHRVAGSRRAQCRRMVGYFRLVSTAPAGTVGDPVAWPPVAGSREMMDDPYRQRTTGCSLSCACEAGVRGPGALIDASIRGGKGRGGAQS